MGGAIGGDSVSTPLECPSHHHERCTDKRTVELHRSCLENASRHGTAEHSSLPRGFYLSFVAENMVRTDFEPIKAGNRSESGALDAYRHSQRPWSITNHPLDVAFQRNSSLSGDCLIIPDKTAYRPSDECGVRLEAAASGGCLARRCHRSHLTSGSATYGQMVSTSTMPMGTPSAPPIRRAFGRDRAQKLHDRIAV